MRHSSPSDTLISISLDMFSFWVWSIVHGQWRVVRRRPRRDASLATGHGRWTMDDGQFRNLRSLISKGFGHELPRFLAQEVHDLSFTVEAHHAPRDLAG